MLGHNLRLHEWHFTTLFITHDHIRQPSDIVKSAGFNKYFKYIFFTQDTL